EAMNRYLLANSSLTDSQVRKSEGAPWTNTIGSPEPCSMYCRRTPLTSTSLVVWAEETIASSCWSNAASMRAEGEAGALLEALAQRWPHQRARRPDAALALHVAHEPQRALGDHLAGRTVARIAVA